MSEIWLYKRVVKTVLGVLLLMFSPVLNFACIQNKGITEQIGEQLPMLCIGFVHENNYHPDNPVKGSTFGDKLFIICESLITADLALTSLQG